MDWFGMLPVWIREVVWLNSNYRDRPGCPLMLSDIVVSITPRTSTTIKYNNNLDFVGLVRYCIRVWYYARARDA